MLRYISYMCQCKYKLYECKYSMNVDIMYVYSITARLWVLVGKKSQIMENSQECYSCVLVSPLLFMCAGITITFHFSYLYSPLFSELFTLSKNSFGHPNTRRRNYFPLEKKMLYHDHFLFANNKTLIRGGKQLCNVGQPC